MVVVEPTLEEHPYLSAHLRDTRDDGHEGYWLGPGKPRAQDAGDDPALRQNNRSPPKPNGGENGCADELGNTQCRYEDGLRTFKFTPRAHPRGGVLW